jgi:hypothetical protein
MSEIRFQENCYWIDLLSQRNGIESKTEGASVEICKKTISRSEARGHFPLKTQYLLQGRAQED